MRRRSDLTGRNVKKRLMELIGTDEVCLNDPEFMQRLMDKIEEDYQMSVQQKMRHLREQEQKRERKLALEGISDSDRSHHRQRKKWSDYVQHRTDKEEEDYFGDNAFEGPPAGNYSLKEKMRRDMERDGQRERCDREEENEDGTEKKESNEKNEEDEEAEEGSEKKPENDEKPKNGDSEGQNNGEVEEAIGEGSSGKLKEEKDEVRHPCAFVNRPFSARVERLIEEESLEGLLELAKELVYVGTK